MVHNNSSGDITLEDQEDESHRLFIPINGRASFHGTIFPWCLNSNDIRSKAFILLWNTWFDIPPGGSPGQTQGEPSEFAFVFQDQDTNRLCWVPIGYHPPANLWGAKQDCGLAPRSYAEIWIGGDMNGPSIVAKPA